MMPTFLFTKAVVASRTKKITDKLVLLTSLSGGEVSSSTLLECLSNVYAQILGHIRLSHPPAQPKIKRGG